VAPAPDPGIALPAGIGRDVLLRACIDCHDLGGLELFAGFYTRADWQEMVLTMVAHGAELDAAEVEQVAAYLAEHFSKPR
jgi:mono/diheme cytochrome c family protein